MTPLGNTIKVKVLPSEKMIGSIIIPDTATPKSHQWGIVFDVSGDAKVGVGVKVLFIGKGCYKEDGIKLVENKRILYWK